MNNDELFALCVKYGTMSKLCRQKFIGLLPEVNQRRLYEKKGYTSIFEFAAKLCGLSAEQVRLALNLERRFEDKPALRKLLVEGEVSINKLTRVAAFANTENQEDVAEKTRILSTQALNVWVKDEKIAAKHDPAAVIVDEEHSDTKTQNSFPKPLFEDKSLYVQTLNFQIDGDIQTELNELHAKGININNLLRKMLDQRKNEIAQEKAQIAENLQPAKSRNLPTRIKKVLLQEHGTKCTIETCNKPSTHYHHTQRFGLSRNHDPHFIAPLCEFHHQIAHSNDIRYQEKRTSWLQNTLQNLQFPSNLNTAITT